MQIWSLQTLALRQWLGFGSALGCTSANGFRGESISLLGTLGLIALLFSAVPACAPNEDAPPMVTCPTDPYTTPTEPCVGAAGADDVCIAGGEFMMGHCAIPYTPPPCPPDEVCGPGASPPTDYAPPHIVKLSPFFIDRYPATNAEYKECYDAGMCPGDCKLLQTCSGTRYTEYRFTDPLQAGYPVATITEEGAEAYCLWKGKRLPTEAEWERAARGPKGFDYPWGNEVPDCTRYLCDPTDIPASWSKYWTAPVGANPGDISPEGVHEMVTSATQLVHDTYDYYYYQQSPYQDPQGPAPGTFRVARGDISLRGLLGAFVVYNGVRSPPPAWVRRKDSVGGVRCARSDTGGK
jgi:formylglycine-generating enzyme required for sulfatase activity